MPGRSNPPNGTQSHRRTATNGMKRMPMAAVLATATVAGTTALSGQSANAADKKYGGTGTCKVKCKDGVCEFEMGFGSGYLTIAGAKNDLKLKLEAKARAEGSTIEGEIPFSIEKKFQARRRPDDRSS